MSSRRRSSIGANDDPSDVREESPLEKASGKWWGTAEELASMDTKDAIAVIRSSEIRIGAFLWTPVGLQIEGQINRDDWEETGRLLKKIQVSLQWIIGDFVVAGEELQYGEQEQLANQLGYAYKTVREYAYVARNVDLSIRMDKLSFGHHQAVAGLSSRDEQRHWLELAAQNDWGVGKLRQQLMEGAETLEKTPVWFKPIVMLQEKYKPEKWKKMKKERRKQIYEVLRALVEQMAQELGD